MSAAPDDDGAFAVTLAELRLYPIKSCAGVAVREALLIETGLELDRAWMLVDAERRGVTQRELPRLALVQPTLRHSDMVLRAPGMLALHVALDAVEQPLRVRLWGDEVDAYDMGDLAAQWFSDFAGQPLRLVRFDPATAIGADAGHGFADAAPLLVASNASLAALNERLAEAGRPAVEMARLRPNLVLDGLPANAEDGLDELRFETPDGPVRLRLTGPCLRCPVVDVDPERGERDDGPLAMLARERSDPADAGEAVFGRYASIVDGIERALRVGLPGRATRRRAG